MSAAPDPGEGRPVASRSAASGPAVLARVRIDAPSRSYEVVIGTGLLDDPATYEPIGAGGVAVVVSDPVVAGLFGERVVGRLRARFGVVALVALEDGEAGKTWAAVERILAGLLDAGADRHAVVFALGGGVVGDLAGFAAAIYMRGIAYVQLPTTLLAQVDSSVGGKTGCNLERGKNLVGAFHQPRLVVADLDTLATLPRRELVAGLAEVIKYGAVADPAFFDWLEGHLDELLHGRPDALAFAVRRSCELKADVVGRDEREAGVRAILNFGHTFGHAIEAATGFGRWLHGEAVGCGMVLAADLSFRLGLLDERAARRVATLVERAGLPTRLPAVPAATLVEWMQHDKKSEGGAPRFVVLEALGRAQVRAVDDRLVRAALVRGGAAP